MTWSNKSCTFGHNYIYISTKKNSKAFTMGEGTPLIRREMFDDGGPRRRTGPQVSLACIIVIIVIIIKLNFLLYIMTLNDTLSFFTTHAQHTSTAAASVGDDDASFAPSSLHEFDKEDRRPFFSKIGGALSSVISPRKGIEEDGDFYQDHYNDQPWRCSFGTAEEDGIWMNRKDQAGTLMSLLVWLLISEWQCNNHSCFCIHVCSIHRCHALTRS
jgi:hypothetical protein